MTIHHRADLPYCYYDQHNHKLVFKLVTTTIDGLMVSVIYGDPFDFQKTDLVPPTHVWDFQQLPLTVRYCSPEETMWEVVMDVPDRRRLKYGFILDQPDGTRHYFSENGLQCIGTAFEPLLNQPAYDPILQYHNHFFYPFIHEVDAPTVADWPADTVWYQIFPERYNNGNPTISPSDITPWENDLPTPKSFYGGDLQGIIDKLPYIKEMGFSGIYMTPIFSSPTNHKYDTSDYYTVDKAFGDLETVKTLVKEAHRLGMKVMFDAVFNHIGAQHVFWQDVLKNQENSKYKDYFHIHRFPVLEGHENSRKLNFDAFAFSANMPKWNTEHPDARKYLIDAAVYWIQECDIDGWRLDVADEVSFSFWRDFRKAVDGAKKEFFVLGEVWHDPSKWLNGAYFDAVMNYPIGVLIKRFFLEHAIDATAFTNGLTKKLMRFSDLHTNVQFNLLDSHDTERALHVAKGDKTALKNAFLFLMMLPGSPSIYYGTEIGMTGGRDPDCRKPMIWDPAQQDLSLKEFFKQLLALRKRYLPHIKASGLAYLEQDGVCKWIFNAWTDPSQKNLVLAYQSNPAATYTISSGHVLLHTGNSESARELSYGEMALYQED